MGTLSTPLSPAQLQALLNGPAGTPPPGVMPNFVDAPNYSTRAITVMSIGMAISTFVLLIRMYTKFFLIRSLALEDYTVTVAWVGSLAYTVLSGITLRWGSGTHVWNVQLKNEFTLLYWINLVSIVYGPVIFLIKLSILLQYKRVFRPTRQANRFLYFGVHTWIWLILLFYFFQTMLDILQCIPRERIWNPLLQTGHCINAAAGIKASGIFNSVSDFVVFSLPIPTIWKLKVPLKKKLGIVAMFSVGFVACIASVLRTIYSLKLTETQDFTYEVNLVGLWALIEVYIGYIVSCLPQSPRFFQFIGPKISSSFTRLASTGIRTKGSAAQSHHRNGSSTLKLPLADSYEPGKNHHVEYITLEERGSKPTEKSTANDTIASIYDGYLSGPDDVERGVGGILVERVTQVESMTPPPRAYGLEGEQRSSGRYMPWL